MIRRDVIDNRDTRCLAENLAHLRRKRIEFTLALRSLFAQPCDLLSDFVEFEGHGC